MSRFTLTVPLTVPAMLVPVPLSVVDHVPVTVPPDCANVIRAVPIPKTPLVYVPVHTPDTAGIVGAGGVGAVGEDEPHAANTTTQK